MADYNQRSVSFFIHSIQSLKDQSGGQRWNAICEDAVELFFKTYPEQIGPNPFTKESLWTFLFDPPSDPTHPLYLDFESLCKNDLFVCFFFQILQSLLDPPAHWWQAHFK